MPAASEPTPDRPALPELPQTWRPFGPRIAAPVFGVILVGAFAWLWINFDDQTRASINVLERATVIGFILVGLVLLYAMARSRVTATTEGLEFVNGFRRRRYAWTEIERIRMPMGAPWPSVDLPGDLTVPMLGIQGSDGLRARRAVTRIKAEHAARRGGA